LVDRELLVAGGGEPVSEYLRPVVPIAGVTTHGTEWVVGQGIASGSMPVWWISVRSRARENATYPALRSPIPVASMSATSTVSPWALWIVVA
jgi:hypothetical protein